MNTLASPSVSAGRFTAILAELTSLVAPVSPVPLARWRAEVLAEWSSRRRSTRDRMAQALAELSDLLPPDATTADLTVDAIGRLAARPGRSATTDGLLSGLRAALRFGIRKGYLSAGALEGAKYRSARRDPPCRRHHGRDAIARVLDHLRVRSEAWEGGRLYALASVYAYTGLRLREALRLRVEDVDVVRGVIFVWPNGGTLKTPGSAAPVPCPRALVAILRKWLGRADQAGVPWVFPGVRRRGPWTGGTTGRRATDRLVQAGRAVGVEGFTPQSLRHSLATHLAGHWGLGSKQIKLILRHSSEGTQAHYIHPDVANLVGLVAGFDYHEAAAPPKPPGPRSRKFLPRRRLARRPLAHAQP